MKTFCLAICAAAITWTFACPRVYSDQQCQIQSTQQAVFEDGQTCTAYSATIDGEPYLALPRDIAGKLLTDSRKKDARIKELEIQAAAKDNLIQQLEHTIAAHQNLGHANETFITEMNEIKDGYKGISNDYQSLNARYKTLTGNYEELTTDYKKISEDYRAMVRGSTLTTDIGIGITSRDNDPAVLFGVGVRRIKLWGFLQEDNSGVILGITLPVF